MPSSSPKGDYTYGNGNVSGSDGNDNSNENVASTSYTPARTRRSTLPIPNPSTSSSSPASTPNRAIRPARLRSRTSTYSQYTSDLAPVLSRENSAEDMDHTHQYPTAPPAPSASASAMMDHLSKSFEAGPSAPHPHPRVRGRKASKSISEGRPSFLVTPAKQSQSILGQQLASPDFLASPSSPEVDMHNSLKRRLSTPALLRRNTTREDGVREGDDAQPEAGPSNDKGRATDSRARSTSTSIVSPLNRDLTEMPVQALSFGPTSTSAPTHGVSHPIQASPPQLWSNLTVTPATPSEIPSTPPDRDMPRSWLTSIYNVGESSIHRLADWTRPHHQHRYHRSERRGSEDDSEKGLNGSEDETVENESRDSYEGQKRNGRYWGIWGTADGEEADTEYFNRTLTECQPSSHFSEFESALGPDRYPASLPTPALSAESLSRESSKRKKLRKAFRSRSRVEEREIRDGWLKTVLGVWTGSGGGKTGEVLRELGWTVGGLVGAFFVTLALVLWLIQGLPITTLKHLPQSTTDLQLLSAEIRSYMSSSEVGWWHTVGVITLVGCWKHAWSVPGAVVLNILVGSLLEPLPALGLLTIITASGSLGAYLLSRPLAPLIAVLFPKPLALVRAALAPDSVPSPSSSTNNSASNEHITPIQTSSDPSVPPIGGPTEKPNVWRRLLIMRAMGFVPWSGMNVACGVVGVDWKIFWLTTAAGSASWSYVTASVGHIISRLQVPTAALAASAASVDSAEAAGESLTSLLRDPTLIGKLVFLSALTLLPVILKRRAPLVTSTPTSQAEGVNLSTRPRSSDTSARRKEPIQIQTPKTHPAISALRLDLNSPPPMSPLSQSLATFTPTPRAFDLLSFGRTAVRTGGNLVVGAVRGTAGGLARFVRG